MTKTECNTQLMSMEVIWILGYIFVFVFSNVLEYRGIHFKLIIM